MSGFLGLQGPNGGDEPLAEGKRYIQSVSTALQTQGLRAGARAYLTTVRRHAQQNAPKSGPFGTSAGYRMGVRASRGGVSGFLHSAAYGNILEAGAAGHYAPIADTVERSGLVSPGLGQWLRKHAPELLAGWGSAKFAKVKTRTGKPWVLPAADRAEAEASEACAEAIRNVVGNVQ